MFWGKIHEISRAVRQIPIREIAPPAFRTRQRDKDEALERLARSVAAQELDLVGLGCGMRDERLGLAAQSAGADTMFARRTVSCPSESRGRAAYRRSAARTPRTASPRNSRRWLSRAVGSVWRHDGVVSASSRSAPFLNS